MKANLVALSAGLLFGAGLLVASITDPMKARALLDVFRDPSLFLVMASAISVHFVLLRLITRRPQPLFAGRFALPTRSVSG